MVVAVLLSWCSHRASVFKKQHQAVVKLQELCIAQEDATWAPIIEKGRAGPSILKWFTPRECFYRIDGLGILVDVTPKMTPLLNQMPTVRQFAMSGEGIPSSQLSAIIEGFPRLEELTVRGAPDGKWLSSIEQLHRLKTLDIEGCVLDGALRDVTLPGSLRSLSLRCTGTEDLTLDFLCGAKGLKELDLSWTRISDKTLVRLHILVELEYLNICGTRVTDAGIAKARLLPSLKRLDTGASWSDLNREPVSWSDDLLQPN